MEIIKAGTTELNREEAEKVYTEKKYIVNYGGVYQPFYSEAQKQFYFQKVIDQKGMARRGRYYTMTAKQINNILNNEILREE